MSNIFYRKLFFTAIICSLCVLTGAARAADAVKTPAAKPAAKATTKPATKTPAKPAMSEEEKYAQVYEKCTKEAEATEAKYDQLFNSCMEKNGFPQEEYETGGQPIPGGDGQE